MFVQKKLSVVGYKFSVKAFRDRKVAEPVEATVTLLSTSRASVDLFSFQK